jgi:hypothetical protein
LIAAATFLVAAAAAYGQNFTRANIGFGFKMLSADMPAGTYEIAVDMGRRTVTFKLLSGSHDKAAQAALKYGIGQKETADANPRLVFRCDSNVCGLSEMWLWDGSGYATNKPKLSPLEREQIAIVRLNTPTGN